MPASLPEDRSMSPGVMLLLAGCALCVLGWSASWFMTPRPAWAHDLPILGVVLAAFAGILRRRKTRATGQPG